MISPATLDQIRSSTDLPSLVREYGVTLQPVAGGFLGLCPFHQERTQSFRVNATGERRGNAHCFGCGWQGNVFTFLMAIESLSFIGAARLLADRAGISIETEAHKTDQQRTRAAEDRAMAPWWWQRCRDDARRALDLAIQDLDKADMLADDGVDGTVRDAVRWKGELEHVHACGRILRTFEGMTGPEKLLQFQLHHTPADVTAWREYVAGEKAFSDAWMGLAV